MDLSEQGIVETSFGENVGEINEDSSVIDLDLVMGKLSVSPTPCESSFVGADRTSFSMVKSDVLGADLLSAVDSSTLAERLDPSEDAATDSIKADAFDSIGQADLSGQRPDGGKCSGKFYSSDLTTEVSVGIDETCKPNHRLIVYSSSRRRSACNSKLSQDHVSPKPSRRGSIANKNSVLDISSLQILRRSRSSLSKRARSSVWGHLGNILPDSKVNKTSDFLGNENKLRRAGSGKGKKNAIRDLTGKKSVGKKCTPTGHISLKIKIGNKICSLGNATENFRTAEEDFPKLFDAVENKLGEKVPGDMVSPCERNLEKVMSSDASGLTSHLDVRGTSDNLSLNSSSGFHQIISRRVGENRCPDVGTSPDSEVVNSVPDAPLFENGLPDIQDSPIMSKACVSPIDVPSLMVSHKKSKKGKKKGKVHQSELTGAETKSNKGKKKNKLPEVGDCSVENKLTGAEITNNAKVTGDLGVGQKVGDVSHSNDSIILTAKPHLNGGELNPSYGPVAALVSSNSQVCDTSIPCSNGQKSPKCFRAKGGKKGKSIILNLPSKKDKVSKKKGNITGGGGKHQVDERVGAGGVSGIESLLVTGNQIPSDFGETGAFSKDLNEPINSVQVPSGEVKDQYILQRNAWVLCDECQKWRRIPAALADQIEETNCRWTCKDNTDKDFADCSIPQEKSNSEINEELEISDASCEEDGRGVILKSNQNFSKVAMRSSWSLIKSNLFLHRSRKTQTIDEVMVCHCKPPSDGRMGCGDNCLNRMLNIECVQGTCPCGELCSNQQFQKRNYAKLKWFRCGKKGYGLQALEDISQGQFLIEYVGEVLDMHSYEARQREYALNGHKHFYFMTLNGSEVIDACAKGNLGRFINHSCDPNCRTEKWMVNGEVCVGLFALRDIKKGEEVTFDYNYVRVFGAAAKKCVCGSTNCRGYIGGDPTNSEVIVQDDSDDEFSEPVMVCESKEMNEDWNAIMSNTLNDTETAIANEPPENNSTKTLISAVDESIMESHTRGNAAQKVEGVKLTQVETMIRERFHLHYSDGNDSVANANEKLDIGKIAGESLNVFVSATLKADTIEPKRNLESSSDAIESAVATASPSKSLFDTIESTRKLKYATLGSDELAKSKSPAKINRSSSSIKKGKLKTKVVNDKATPDGDKVDAALHKSKKLPELHLTNHVEAVEEKLNELLDPEGGISKRKDASRGYLKLLFLTAASGNNGHGEAIQSNRDLSMILDALLKTKSRTVLVDIINKNGLQMLHNIMKRYRKEFIKTPILRKLLKVLEYLAIREILTLEHITGGPPCPGVESFKDSILSLTEHADKQVHQIARSFRDRWIPRSHRKNCCMERDDGRIDFHQRSSYVGSSVSYDHHNDRGVINSCETQPVAASSTVETPSIDVPSASGGSCGINGTKTRKRKSRWDTPAEEYPNTRIRTNLAGDEKQNMDEDFPPGFSPPCNGPKVPTDASSAATNHQEREILVKQHQSDSILGCPQLRFVSRMPISYGVPCFIMQQFGVLQAGKSEGWTIAPGVPFHLFPPLPPHARGSTDQPTSSTRCASLSEPTEKTGQCSDNPVTYHTSQQHTTTCSIDPPESVSLANGRPDFQQGGSNGLGRKYFRQQKWNHSKMAPPWVRMRNGWGYTGNNIRNGSPGVGLGNGTNEFRDSCNSEEVNWRGGL
ncbi:Histone-lysine N-methyltransferase [Handroanthus impetiginosus]|uniref:Histone-lysine N-methyltransferase n=1 Tax=Handroanthus impetiginosus TaxID=429701 RepID=A0A2G9HWY6_9LAMI|nr:Histone-lysine N-methyltransferase [Handroanthus impetiginosus]